jgi:DNA polymerase-1
MSAGTPADSLYLIDAHSLIFQVFYAIRGMTSPSGLPTNALFGFVRDVLFLRSLDPTYLICAFDRSEPTFRSDLYAPYKANREAMPDDLQLQLPLIHQALAALHVPVISVEKFEADDVMATLARIGDERGMEVFLCTTDKDCRQLITDRVRLYNLRKHETFGKDELKEDWGIRPDQVVDLQTLVGDSVDNVPGVPGIGIKTGAKLLQEFDTIENLIANVAKVPGAKKQEALKASADIIKTSRSLVKLDTHVPIEEHWDAWRLQPIDVQLMLDLCKEWGFQSLASQIRAAHRSSAPAAGPAKGVQTDLFSAEEELFPFGANEPESDQASQGAVRTESPDSAMLNQAPAKTQARDYRLVDTSQAFEDLLGQLRQQSRFAIDLETTGLDPLVAQIVGIALSWQSGQGWYLPLRGPMFCKTLDASVVLAALKGLLEDPQIAKINQNIKYDQLVLRANGVRVRGVVGDPMVADYLLHAGERSHNLEEMARRYLKIEIIPIADLIGKKTRTGKQLRMDEVPTDKVCEYAAEDADIAWQLITFLEKQLNEGDKKELRSLYDELEIPLIDVLAEMEFNGIRVDTTCLANLSKEMADQLATIEGEIYALAGKKFNIASLPQLRTVLFDELKLPIQGKTGVTGAASTDQESLEKLAALDHPAAPLPRKILEHRQITKLKGTYVDALPELVNAKSKRVHTSFNQTITATGRLSSTDPNLQNIPARKEMGKQIRQAFVPETGWTLVTADYSQIELRLLAHFCADDALRRAFEEDRDVHTAVAAQIFHVAEQQVTSEQRRMAKTVNFGVIYGISAAGLAQRLQIKKEEGAEFIAAYFKRYPKVEAYQTALLAECRRKGYVATILGRRRRFDPSAIRAFSSYQNRNAAEREAINMQVQGSAADLIKAAMLDVWREMNKQNLQTRLLLQIHDELVFEAPPQELPKLLELIRHFMTVPVAKRLQLSVPLRVDLATGPNWLEVTPI